MPHLLKAMVETIYEMVWHEVVDHFSTRFVGQTDFSLGQLNLMDPA
jgi:hypothetical protein